MKDKTIKLSEVKENPDNPRVIKGEKFKKLVKSLKEFPEMMKLRPIVVNENNMVLGGNMRLNALKQIGHTEIPESWVKKAEDLTEDQQKEFIVKDNVGFGEHDWDLLANQYDVEQLEDWGLDVKLSEDFEPEVEAEEKFSEFIDEEHNYVVLYFDNRVDWLQAETHFGLQSVFSKRANGKKWSKGIGRVLNGSEYLKKLTDDV